MWYTVVMNIAFTGGGTAGHIYPGLAVIAELKKHLPGSRLFWIGSSAGMDSSIVKKAGIDFYGIPAGKLRRYFSLRTVLDGLKVLAGFWAARKILKKEKPVLLFSKGGFVSVPPCAAAASLRIPVFTHESDFSPGLATKINARYVQKTGGRIFTAYKETIDFFPNAVRPNVTVSGNPVREVFRNADAAKGRAFLGLENGQRILLVLGGSQGAREINGLIRDALPELTKIYTVVHQTGFNQQWDLPNTERYKSFPFIKDELPHVMAAAELVLGRSGAGIWEWAVLGKPMLLIPLRGAGTRGDQIENARYFEKTGAAYVLEEGASADILVNAVASIAQNDEKRAVMAGASLKTGELDGTGIIAHTLADVIKNGAGS